MSEEDLSGWGDIVFDNITTYDLISKTDEVHEAPDKLIKILNSEDPLAEGLFTTTGDNVTSENLFHGLVEDDDDQDQADIHKLLSAHIDQNNPKGNKNSKNSHNRRYLPNGSLVPDFAQDNSIIDESISLTALQLSPLELTVLDQQHKIATFQATSTTKSPNNNQSSNLANGEFISGVRTSNGYLVSTRDEIISKLRTMIMNVSELCYLTEPESESLLRFHQWDLGPLQSSWLHDPLKARLEAGVWRHADTNCYVFGIGCLSHFLTTSPMLLRTTTPINNQNHGKSSNYVDFSMTWSELIKQLYFYYQGLYFQKTSPSKPIKPILETTGNKATRQIHEDDEYSIENAQSSLIIPDDLAEVENSLLQHHSAIVTTNLGNSYKFKSPSHQGLLRPMNSTDIQTVQTSSVGLSFPTLNSHLIVDHTAQSQMLRRNSISFSRLDLPLQALYFNHAKKELESILVILLHSFHFPQTLDLKSEFLQLQRTFSQFATTTKSVDDPTFFTGFNNASETYNTQLQERLHSFRQILQYQNKICPNSGVVSSNSPHYTFLKDNSAHLAGCGSNCNAHHDVSVYSPLLTQRVLDTTDVPPLTTSYSLLTHNMLENSIDAMDDLFGKNNNKNDGKVIPKKPLIGLSSDLFLTNIILPLDNILSSFTNPHSKLPLSPSTISESLLGVPLLSYLFSYFQQKNFFLKKRQIAEIFHHLSPSYGAEDANDPFGILKAEKLASGGIGNDGMEIDGDVPSELAEWADVMHSNEVSLWNDVFVEEDEVVQISPFLFNLPHHSIGSSSFYVKRPDFELMYTLLSYQRLNLKAVQGNNSVENNIFKNNFDNQQQQQQQPADFFLSKDEIENSDFYFLDEKLQVMIPHDPSLDDILELFRQTDYYARFILFHSQQQSVLPPGKSSSVHIPSFYQPTLYVQCSTAFCNIVRLDYASALGCGHYFCRDCWRTNLVHQLSENGREAAIITCMGGEYPHEDDSSSLDMTNHVEGMEKCMAELLLWLGTEPLNRNNELTPFVPLTLSNNDSSALTATTTTTTTTTTTQATSKFESIRALAKNKLNRLVNSDKGTTTTTTTTTAKSIIHPLAQYKLQGKCHSIVPMSFLRTIVDSSQCPYPSQPVLPPTGYVGFLEQERNEMYSINTLFSLRESKYPISTLQSHPIQSQSSLVPAHGNDQVHIPTLVSQTSLNSDPNKLLSPQLNPQLSLSRSSSQQGLQPRLLSQNPSSNSSGSGNLLLKPGAKSFFTADERGISFNNLLAAHPVEHSDSLALSSNQINAKLTTSASAHVASGQDDDELVIIPTSHFGNHAVSHTSLNPGQSLVLTRGGSSQTYNSNQGGPDRQSFGINLDRLPSVNNTSNTPALFPSALSTQQSLRKKEVDRMYSASGGATTGSSGGGGGGGELVEERLQSNRSLGEQQKPKRLYNPLLSTKTLSQQHSDGKTSDNGDDMKDMELQIENPNKLTLAGATSLSPAQIVSPVHGQRTAFVPDEAPTINYNKLLWWILDIFVAKQPHIKWCPNPTCDSSQVSNTNELRAAETTSAMNALYEFDYYTTIPLINPHQSSVIKPAEKARYPYAITRTVNSSSHNVDCLCGSHFCFRCLGPAHAPTPCDLFTRWGKTFDEGSSDIYILAKTKPCPKCGVLIEKNKACNHMSCTCKHQFCWLCLKPWFQHTGGYTCTVYDNQEKAGKLTDIELKIRQNATLLTKYEFYAERYKQHKHGIEYCQYLKSVATAAFQRCSNFVLYCILQRCNNPTSSPNLKIENYDGNWRDEIGKFDLRVNKTGSISTISKLTQKEKDDRHVYASSRLKAAVASCNDRTRLNIYNLDIQAVVLSLGGELVTRAATNTEPLVHGNIPNLVTTNKVLTSQNLLSPTMAYRKTLHDVTAVPMYYPTAVAHSFFDISNKQKHNLNYEFQEVIRAEDLVNEQFTDFRERFHFIFFALNELILARRVLQYSFIVAYYLKTTSSSLSDTGKQTKSQKQLFEMQLKYLVEPTEKLQSYMDAITDDLTYVFYHRRIILQLVSVLEQLRKFLLSHVEGDKAFEEALLYEPDTDMVHDIWRCSCNVDHPLTLLVCPTCVECKIHREPECKACAMR